MSVKPARCSQSVNFVDLPHPLARCSKWQPAMTWHSSDAVEDEPICNPIMVRFESTGIIDNAYKIHIKKVCNPRIKIQA